MSRPTIGVVISTPGRRSILRTMNSILYQGTIPGDDVIVVGDGYHKPTADLVELMGPPFRYVATEKTRDWGHSQVNYGLKHVRGDWVTIQDDDDIFIPRAFDEMRTIVSRLESPRPVIGRVMSPYLGLLWTAPGVEPLDGHCLVVPNDKKKLGYFGLEYAGDQKWIATNLEAYDTYSWADRIWALTRPTWGLWATLHPNTGGWMCWTFSREFGGIPIADLWMMEEDEHFAARLNVHRDIILTQTEACDIAEFAAYAGQCNDVWFRAHPSDQIVTGLIAVGYTIHIERGDLVEYTHTWPPRRFEPAGILKEKAP